jgi:hypothetical protein
MGEQCKEWKWSNGIPYEKSIRKQIIQYAKTDEELELEQQEGEQETAISQSLNSHAFSYGETLFSRNESGNRREETYSKMAEREMVNKINQNPFLMNADYVNDLMTQDKYMKPLNTTFETIKK